MTLVFCGLYFPLFYIQLDAVKHGLNPTFAFYLVRTPFQIIISLQILKTGRRFQISILNTSSIAGRILPGFSARRVGVANTTLIFGAFCGVLNFAMLGVRHVADFVVFAILYGFFSGACECISTCSGALAWRLMGDVMA